MKENQNSKNIDETNHGSKFEIEFIIYSLYRQKDKINSTIEK